MAAKLLASSSIRKLLPTEKLRFAGKTSRNLNVKRCIRADATRSVAISSAFGTASSAWHSRRVARHAAPRAALEDCIELEPNETPGDLQYEDLALVGAIPVERDPEARRHASTADLLRFTLPTLGIWLIGPILSLVDTAFVGANSTVQLGAMGPGTMLCDYSLYVCTFLAIAVTNMLAICFAKRDKKGVNEVLSDSLSIALVLGTLLGLTFYAISPSLLSRIAGPASADVVAPALSYVRIRCLGFPAALVIFVTQSVFLAAQDPITPLLATAAAGIINLGGDYIACNVLGMGIAGAALATAAAQIATAVLLLVALRKPLKGSIAGGQRVMIDWRLPTLAAAGIFLKFAGPICGIMLAKVTMFSVLTSAASSIGVVAASSHHVCFSVWTFFAVYGDAVSQAAQTFLPASIGYPEAAWQFAKRIMLTGCVVGIMNSILSGMIVTLAPTLFTKSAAVMAMMAALAPIMAGTLVIHNVSMATEGMLLASRDLGFLLSSYIFNTAMVIVVLKVAEAAVGRNIMVVWFCILQFQAVRLLQNGLRLMSQKSCLNEVMALPASA